MAKKGEIDREITTKLSELYTQYQNLSPSSIFQENTAIFLESFEQELNDSIQDILHTFPELSKKEAQLQKKFTFKMIRQILINTHIQKALCEITFPAFPILKFIEAFSGLIDEAQFRITENNIIVNIMDPSRICLIQLKLSDESFKFYQEDIVAFNLDDFKKICYCQAGDKSTTKLIFGKEHLFISIHSEKYNSQIDRTLDAIDLTIEEPPLDMLYNIEYLVKYSLEKSKFDYMLKNLGIYSEIIDISVDRDKIIFQEQGQIGKGELIWKKDQLKDLEIELKDQIFPHQIAGYSLTFMGWIGKMCSILEKNEYVQFYLKYDHPLRAEITFNKLGVSSMLFFLAPRAIEAEFEENDDIDDF